MFTQFDTLQHESGGGGRGRGRGEESFTPRMACEWRGWLLLWLSKGSTLVVAGTRIVGGVMMKKTMLWRLRCILYGVGSAGYS